MLGAALAALGSVAVSGGVSDPGMLSSLGLLAAMGVGMFGAGAFRLPGWARLRQRQMAEIAARVAPVASLQSTNDRLK